ncbi:MAG: bifunctional precorrin-2 dehydrogenase/sirohydrochlorin ferrochelatase [Spirochaetia bacterium]|nr:bifunctional precorrin-2 dehydrogenase/sirohydrochlorin ferrochelatase [Spirochaetia bacterium]
MNRYFPIFLDLKNKPVLIAGGGNIAAQKLRSLMHSEAKITLAALEFCNDIQEAAIKNKNISIKITQIEKLNIDDYFLIITALNDKKTNNLMVKKARKKKILINSVDDPENCDFFTASTIRRQNIVIAVSSGGFFPGLTKTLRKIIDALLPDSHFAYLIKIYSLRKKLQKKIKNNKEREKILKQIASDIENKYF